MSIEHFRAVAEEKYQSQAFFKRDNGILRFSRISNLCFFLNIK